VTSVNGIGVLVNSDGKLGTTTSSPQFKEQIKPMAQVSEALFALKPVSFRYNKGNDPAGTSQMGLVAEDVEKVNPDLVVRDKEGKAYNVRYDQVNAMLPNEFLKEHRKVEQLGKDFESEFAEQQKQIETLTAGLQKVSAQLEASNPAQQVVNNQ
jgi:trimeric autotransporter adhesin